MNARMGKMIIRRMTDDDLSEVAFIERECFSQPWSENGLKESLEAGNYIFLVACDDGKIVGYLGLFKACGEGDITNVAVLASYRRRGIARKLLEALFDLCVSDKLECVHLEVRKSNEGAIKLYENTGFSVDGVRKGFYSNPREDAILMTKKL